MGRAAGAASRARALFATPASLSAEFFAAGVANADRALRATPASLPEVSPPGINDRAETFRAPSIYTIAKAFNINISQFAQSHVHFLDTLFNIYRSLATRPSSTARRPRGSPPIMSLSPPSLLALAEFPDSVLRLPFRPLQLLKLSLSLSLVRLYCLVLRGVFAEPAHIAPEDGALVLE